MSDLRDVFENIMALNRWSGGESRSGPGSTLSYTCNLRSQLEIFLKTYEIKTFFDAPCGDFNWMKLLDLPIQYLGADVVEDIVAENKRRFGNHSRSFTRLDLTGDTLPKVDLIFCRDCLFHFSFEHISSALGNMKRSSPLKNCQISCLFD